MKKEQELINLQQEVAKAKYEVNYNLGRLDAFNGTLPRYEYNDAYNEGYKEGQRYLEEEYKKIINS